MEDTLKGYFWTADDELLKHYGEITISAKANQYEIKIYGSFPIFEKPYSDINFHDDILCIYGFTKEQNYITIIGLRLENIVGATTTHEHSAFRSEHVLSFRQFISGSRLFNPADKINTLSVSAQFLNGWTKSDSIRQKMPHPNRKGGINPALGYDLYEVEPLNIPFPYGICTFHDYIKRNHRFDVNNLNIQQQTCFFFQFKIDMDIEAVYIFLQRFREFYSLVNGVNLGLCNIEFMDSSNQAFTYTYDKNILNSHYSSIRSGKRIVSLEKLSYSEYLGNFFQLYDQFRLPMSHLMSYLNSDRRDYINYIQPFVSAMEIIYNKSFKDADLQSKALNPTLKEILSKYQLSPKHRQFLTNAKLAKSYRDFHLRDKLIRVINHSPKLVKLVDDPPNFVQRILDLRHYLVHEVDKEHTDLSLLTSKRDLGKHIVKMKIIIEYHLLLLMQIEQEIVEEKIDCTFPNFVHFERI
ncbi:HEPN domain-containing protein [Pedobacter jeongneungensis]|uniref:ApeA N-terminal domain 1-containing protein n=1 Tax=Pedobacter jeongneungensis TaxID=947309 RepID=UPI000469FC60|nr:HEPN domain-containing protein [Pedobacter jeongneungensis]